MYSKAIENEPTHEVAFELATILAQQQSYDKSLMQFTTCIELAKEKLSELDMDPGKLAEYHMHRAAVYEALGLMEHSKRDLHRILEADPNFIQKYHAHAM